MSINTDFFIEGFDIEEGQQLLGYLGRSNSSGYKFSKVYAKKDTNTVCGSETYLLGDFLAKRDELIEVYKEFNGLNLERDIETIKTSFSILTKILPPTAKIEIEWG